MTASQWVLPPAFPLALVTGGAHRLGKVLALSLARQGYAVLLHFHRSDGEAAATADEIRALGVPAFPLGADLGDTAQIDSLVASLDAITNDSSNHLLPLRVLVNSAAVMPRADARTLTVAEWDTTLALNLRAPFLLSQAAARRMSDGGLIVNVTDVGAQRAWSGFPAYAVSKAGLESLTRILARSFAPSIRVNAIAPGLVLPSAGLPADDWYRLTARAPLKRPASPEEIAGALEFLLKNEYITGQTITVDGGYSLL
jgi:NAD(P)-dependent dehydrogenase (short-subunit alcohol dehydrogenase family)